MAGAAALVLLFFMAMDWYGSATGDEARRIESLTDNPSGAESGEIDRRLNEDAAFVAEREEQNAWQADGVIDRVLLGLLLATVALTLVTALARLAGARPTKGIGPPGLASLLALGAAVLVTYRIIQEPGLDQATTVKPGAPLALLALAAIALGLASALRADEEAREDGEPRRRRRRGREGADPEPAA